MSPGISYRLIDDAGTVQAGWSGRIAGGTGTVRLRYGLRDGGWLTVELSGARRSPDGERRHVRLGPGVDLSVAASCVTTADEATAALEALLDALGTGTLRLRPAGERRALVGAAGRRRRRG